MVYNTTGLTRAADCHFMKNDFRSRRAVGSFAEQGRVRVVISSGRIYFASPGRANKQTADAEHKQVMQWG